jgi:hypothetical protein
MRNLTSALNQTAVDVQIDSELRAIAAELRDLQAELAADVAHRRGQHSGPSNGRPTPSGTP